MKLTFAALMAAFLIFAYAGVQPMTTAKNTAFSFTSSFLRDLPLRIKQLTYSPGSVPVISNEPVPSGDDTSGQSNPGIDPHTGIYKNYYLGLVEEPDGTDCDSYGNFVVMVNNRNAADPTYAQLMAFLKADTTDSHHYDLVVPTLRPYHGNPESYVDLSFVRAIIDGTALPDPPRICVDFAETLHNAAEMAGIRYGFVSIDLSGSSDGHALDVFETTDRGSYTSITRVFQAPVLLIVTRRSTFAWARNIFPTAFSLRPGGHPHGTTWARSPGFTPPGTATGTTELRFWI